MMKDGRFIRAWLTLALLLSYPTLSRAIESTWLIDGSFSALVGRDPSRLDDPNTQTDGTQSSVYVMPVIGWRGSRLFLSPSVDITYSGVKTPLEVDDDLFLFSQQVDSLLELGGTFKSNADSRWTSKAFFESFAGKVTKDEVWGKGLYDYADGGVYLDWTRKWDTHIPTKTIFGIKISDRRYPNFTSLDGSGVREKDTGIFKFYTDYELFWPKARLFTTTVSYALQLMSYKEARIVDESGTTTKADGSPTDLRQDIVHSLSLSAPLELGHHSLFLTYAGEIRVSNLAEFDSQEFFYLPDFNDYFENSITLGYGYQFNKHWIFISPYVGTQVTALTRGYIGRPAQDSQGAFKSELQRDKQIQVNVDVNSTFTEHWGFFWNFNSTTYSSNNDNEGSSLYNYRFVTTSLGFQFSY